MMVGLKEKKETKKKLQKKSVGRVEGIYKWVN